MFEGESSKIVSIVIIVLLFIVYAVWNSKLDKIKIELGITEIIFPPTKKLNLKKRMMCLKIFEDISWQKKRRYRKSKTRKTLKVGMFRFGTSSLGEKNNYRKMTQ